TRRSSDLAGRQFQQWRMLDHRHAVALAGGARPRAVRLPAPPDGIAAAGRRKGLATWAVPGLAILRDRKPCSFLGPTFPQSAQRARRSPSQRVGTEFALMPRRKE